MSVDGLHRRLLESWNAQDAETYASLFARNASLVGFDGSMVDGRAAIGEHLFCIFVDHKVAKYVRIVRDVRELAHGDDRGDRDRSAAPRRRGGRCAGGLDRSLASLEALLERR